MVPLTLPLPVHNGFIPRISRGNYMMYNYFQTEESLQEGRQMVACTL